MQLVYIAIAIAILIIIWLALQPKQGAKASNAPNDGPDDGPDERPDDGPDSGPDLLPKPEAKPHRPPSAPFRQSRLPVAYELPDELDDQQPAAADPAAADPVAADPVAADIVEQARTLMEQGRKIEAIKLVRAATGCGLKETKAYVETFPTLGPLPNCAMPSMASHPQAAAAIDREQVWALMEQGQKIKAIKLVRTATGWGLKDAKTYVEQLPSHDVLDGTTRSGAEPSLTASNVSLEPFDIDRHTVNDRLRMLLQQQRKVSAVKLVRQVMEVSLKDAVTYVEAYPDVDPLPVMERGPVCDRIRDLLDQQLTMAAAELVQQRTGMALPEALEYLKQNFDGDFPGR